MSGLISTLAAHHRLASLAEPAWVHLWVPADASGTSWTDSVGGNVATGVGVTLDSSGATYTAADDVLNIHVPSLSLDLTQGGDDFSFILAANITSAKFGDNTSTRILHCSDEGNGVDVSWNADDNGYRHRRNLVWSVLETTPTYPVNRVVVIQRSNETETIRWASKSGIISEQATDGFFEYNPDSFADSYQLAGIGNWSDAMIARAMPGTIPAFGIASEAISNSQLLVFANNYL